MSSAVIAQSGGPTAVINASFVGCVEGLRDAGFDGKILGAHHAVRGIDQNDFIDLSALDAQTLDAIARTPSSALGSSRDKPDAAYAERIAKRFQEMGVEHFFYIGGNDSSDTCRIVAEAAASLGTNLRAFHVPKTIDNDLVGSDHTPGFGSAARFVACAVRGDDLDNRALPGVKIDVIMGRHAGFLTAASALARVKDGDGPHVICLPEAAFDVDQFVEAVKKQVDTHGRCVVAASEGIHDSDGTPIAVKLAENVERDSHGNVQLSGTGALGDHLRELVKSRLGEGARVRADTFGYLQRSFVGCVSEVDFSEAREVGRFAGRCAMDGTAPGSLAIQRADGPTYAPKYVRHDFSDVAAKTQVMPAEYFDGDAFDVTDAFLDYARPLVGDLPQTVTL